MVTVIIIVATFGGSLLCSTVLTPLVRDAAVRRGQMDHALSSRKIHTRPTPRLGGIAIVAGFYAPLLILLALDSLVGALFTSDLRLVAGVFGGGAAIAALGLYDDLVGAGARSKFAVQFGIAAFAYACGFRIDAVSVPLAGVIELGTFGFPLTLVWIAGVVNALNLIDGLDGLAGGVAFIVLASVFMLALGRSDALVALFAASMAGAVLGFLFFNFNPASIFMGDTGSMFLGFVLATTSIHTAHKNSTPVALLVPVIALGLPIADTLLTIARRALRGTPLFAADCGHIHHRLLARGLSQKQTALTLYGFSAFLGGAALVVAWSNDGAAVLSLAVLAGAVIAGLRWLGFLNVVHLQEILTARRRNLTRRGQLVGIRTQLQRAADTSTVWQSLVAAAPILDVDHVALKACGNTWATSPGAKLPDMHVARFSLRPERPGADILELGWRDGRGDVDRDTEIAIEQLCRAVRAALKRLDGPVARQPSMRRETPLARPTRL